MAGLGRGEKRGVGAEEREADEAWTFGDERELWLM
jgi:hypothetical protein